jgi:hypothetical protein
MCPWYADFICKKEASKSLGIHPAVSSFCYIYTDLSSMTYN